VVAVSFADYKGAHRDTGTDDVGPAEHQPPEENQCRTFHKAPKKN